MDKAILRKLDEPTRARIAETQPGALRKLDENALCDLHTRIRRARNKYSKLYRRRSSARVVSSGSRGVARPKYPRVAAKAELYEDALARVSKALAVAARGSAARMRAARIRDEKAAKVSPRASSRLAQRGRGRGAHGRVRSAPAKRPKSRTPIMRKRHASTRAQGARRQARRDSR